MGFLSSVLGVLGFGFIGLPLGLLVGFFLFIYSKPNDDQVEVTFIIVIIIIIIRIQNVLASSLVYSFVDIATCFY